MTQDEIIEMLAKVYGVAWTSKAQLRDLTAFAKLVAQHEREACAKIVEEHAKVYAKLEKSPITSAAWAACIDIHDSISERGDA